MANIWYSHYPGDYIRDTARLSLAEHGVYRLLLDHYYSTGAPLPTDISAVYRLCRASKKSERTAVDSILNQYFLLESDGYHNQRADRELVKQAEKRNKLSTSGSRGAAKRWGGNSQTDGHANSPGSGHASDSLMANPQPHPQSESKSESRSESQSESEPQTEEEEKQKIASAFSVFFEVFGIKEPFGNLIFQRAWVEAYGTMQDGESFTDAMERAAQKCKMFGVSPPRLFFDLKRKIEQIELDNKSKKTPL